jgi:hypothetical protein
MHSEGSALEEKISKKEVLHASMKLRSFCFEYEGRKGYFGFLDLFYCEFVLFCCFFYFAHVVDTHTQREKGMRRELFIQPIASQRAAYKKTRKCLHNTSLALCVYVTVMRKSTAA